MPTSWQELFDSAIDFGVAQVRFDSRAVSIEATQMSALRQKQCIRLNPLVLRAEGGSGAQQATFRRYLPPVPISVHEEALVERAEHGLTIAEAHELLRETAGLDVAEGEAVIAALRKKRVVAVVGSSD
jgi:hypothetical protein